MGRRRCDALLPGPSAMGRRAHRSSRPQYQFTGPGNCLVSIRRRPTIDSFPAKCRGRQQVKLVRLKMSRRNRPLLLLVILLCAGWLLSPAGAGAQQTGITHYVYDDNGRLVAVILSSGDATVYAYDLAGNPTSVRQVPASGLELITFTPHEGSTGDSVTFYGVGFGSGVTSLLFNGVPAHVSSVDTGQVIANVPQGATTGPITIVTPKGAVTSAESFRISPRITVAPAAISISPGDATQFTAIL